MGYMHSALLKNYKHTAYGFIGHFEDCFGCQVSNVRHSDPTKTDEKVKRKRAGKSATRNKCIASSNKCLTSSI